jgi:hypothetical protein
VLSLVVVFGADKFSKIYALEYPGHDVDDNGFKEHC